MDETELLAIVIINDTNSIEKIFLAKKEVASVEALDMLISSLKIKEKDSFSKGTSIWRVPVSICSSLEEISNYVNNKANEKGGLL